MHLARRVAGREVERGEIVEVALDVRPFGDGEAHLGEDGDHLVHHLADRVDAPGSRRGGGTGRVTSTRLGGELRFERGPLERAPARRERVRDLIA